MWNNKMFNEREDSHRPDLLQDRLDMHRRRIQDSYTALQVYREFLSDEERKRVGPLVDAYLRNGQTVGIWMQAKGVGRNLAIIEIAKQLGLPDGEYDFLLRQIGEARSLNHSSSRLPIWKRDVYELWFDGEMIKRILRPKSAKNQGTVLTAFQEDGWPNRIDSPLKKSCDLRSLVKRLNERLQRVRFERDGTGRGLRWFEI